MLYKARHCLQLSWKSHILPCYSQLWLPSVSMCCMYRNYISLWFLFCCHGVCADLVVTVGAFNLGDVTSLHKLKYRRKGSKPILYICTTYLTQWMPEFSYIILMFSFLCIWFYNIMQCYGKWQCMQCYFAHKFSRGMKLALCWNDICTATVASFLLHNADFQVNFTCLCYILNLCSLKFCGTLGFKLDV